MVSKRKQTETSRLNNREFLRNFIPDTQATGPFSWRDFMEGHPDRWLNRTVFIFIMGVFGGAIGLVATRNLLFLAVAVGLGVTLQFVPCFPVILEAGTEYLVVNMFFNVVRAVEGGLTFIRPHDRIISRWVGMHDFEVRFEDMHEIPTLERASLSIFGEGQLQYVPSVLNFSGLNGPERRRRWNSEIRLSLEDIQYRLNVRLRDEIKTYLAQFEGEDFWLVGLMMLRDHIVTFLGMHRFELGISVDTLTVDMVIPPQVVKARHSDWAEEIAAYTQHRSLISFFDATGMPLTVENINTYLALNNKNIRMRLSGNAGDLFGGHSAQAGMNLSPAHLLTPARSTTRRLSPPRLSLDMPPPVLPLWRRLTAGSIRWVAFWVFRSVIRRVRRRKSQVLIVANTDDRRLILPPGGSRGNSAAQDHMRLLPEPEDDIVYIYDDPYSFIDQGDYDER